VRCKYIKVYDNDFSKWRLDLRSTGPSRMTRTCTTSRSKQNLPDAQVIDPYRSSSGSTQPGIGHVAQQLQDPQQHHSSTTPPVKVDRLTRSRQFDRLPEKRSRSTTSSTKSAAGCPMPIVYIESSSAGRSRPARSRFDAQVYYSPSGPQYLMFEALRTRRLAGSPTWATRQHGARPKFSATRRMRAGERTSSRRVRPPSRRHGRRT